MFNQTIYLDLLSEGPPSLAANSSCTDTSANHLPITAIHPEHNSLPIMVPVRILRCLRTYGISVITMSDMITICFPIPDLPCCRLRRKRASTPSKILSAIIRLQSAI